MPPRRRADHLTDEQLEELNSALAEGRRATVYLVEGISSLGLEPGTSARVISIAGTTVTVRPKGVNDELPFETDELRFTRDVATKSSPKAAPAKAPATRAPAPKPPAAPVAKTETAQPAPRQATPRPATKEKTTVTSTPANPPAAAEPAKPKAPAKRGAKKPASISITVTIDSENEWTVAVAQGTRKIGKPAAVAPDAVERAVKELGDETAIEAVHSVIDEARRTVEERVAQLSRELDEARKALESLGANPA